MNPSELLSEDNAELMRHGRRLLQIGAFLFLLALIIGLFVQKFTVPRLGLSAHLLGLMQGLFLMVAGLIWPKLTFTSKISKIALCLVLYGCFAAWAANLLAGFWGAGNSLLPIAAGTAHGSVIQEMLVMVGLRTGAPALILSVVLIVWGLRSPKEK